LQIYYEIGIFRNINLKELYSIMKLSIAAFCIIVVLLVSLRFHLNASTPQSSTILEIHKTEGIPVTLGRPEFTDLFKKIHPTGNIKETKQLSAAFEVNGRLKTLSVHVGQYINKGELIAELDTRTQETIVSAARASLSIAEANLKKAIKGPREEELATANAMLEGVNSTLKYSKEELVRVRDLVSKGAAPQKQLDQANNEYKNAISAKEVAKTRVDLLTAGTREEDIMAAKAQVLLARAHLETSIIGLEDHKLVALLSGLVSSVPVEEGDVIKSVPSAQTIAEILEVSPILFECSISELFIPYLTNRTVAAITIDSFPGIKYEGTFYELVPKGNLSDRTFTVRFSIKNSDKELKPGMFGRSTIILSNIENAMTIPIQVLRDPATIEDIDGGEVQFNNIDISSRCKNKINSAESKESEPKPLLKAVMVSINGFAAARLVHTGFISGNLIEIKSGLLESDLVVTEGFAELKTGAKLYITPKNRPELITEGKRDNSNSNEISREKGVN
jgi:multidrug efflux pump subunit AcrA (membrane-fusion protein)